MVGESFKAGSAWMYAFKVRSRLWNARQPQDFPFMAVSAQLESLVWLLPVYKHRLTLGRPSDADR